MPDYVRFATNRCVRNGENARLNNLLISWFFDCRENHARYEVGLRCLYFVVDLSPFLITPTRSESDIESLTLNQS